MNSFEHFDRLFVFATAGVSLALVGVVNLAFGRRTVRAALSVAVCGAATAAIGSVTRNELAVQTAGLLCGALLVTALIGSGWAHRRVEDLCGLLRKRTARWGVMAVCGLGVALGSVVRFEIADQAVTEKQTLDLESELGRQPNQPTERARAATDRGTRIVLKEPLSTRDPEALASPEEKMLRDTHLSTQVIRHGGPSDVSNCHGWVFTGGKFLLSPEDVELILKENGYDEVHEPQPGDVAVFRQNGVVAHTALVRYVAGGQPVLVESKWGTMGVFLHPADKSPYGTDFTFHRSTRNGHTLVGLREGGSDLSAAPAVSAGGE